MSTKKLHLDLFYCYVGLSPAWVASFAGDWLTNWLACFGFLRAFDCLPSSIRHSFNPYLFSILRIDPSKPVKPTATAIPATTAGTSPGGAGTA